MTDQIKEQTYYYGFPICTRTGFFFLVAARLWLTVEPKYHRQSDTEGLYYILLAR